MKYLKIEKFIDNQHETTIKIPFFIFRIFIKFLPKKTIVELSAKGIHLDEILAAYAQKIPYACTSYVSENKIKKRIVISL